MPNYNVCTMKCRFTTLSTPNGVAMIFFGGATRPMSPGRFSEADQIQWGGGLVAEIFRDLHKRNAFAERVRGGGGVVAYIFFC